MRYKSAFIAIAVTSLLSACGSTPEIKNQANLPEWILNPVSENGLAATDCTRYSGNLSIDKKVATANARLALAQQIDVRIEGLEKTFANRVDAQQSHITGSTFSSVSKQITQQHLSGSRLERADIIEIDEKKHFCAKVVLNPAATKALFKDLIHQVQPNYSADDASFLYQEFKAFKAEQSLEKEVARLTN